MKLTIEEIPDPRKHPSPCVVCGGRPRYFAVLHADGPSATRRAFPLCNDCAIDQGVLDSQGVYCQCFFVVGTVEVCLK
jgi:hypothetical protein